MKKILIFVTWLSIFILYSCKTIESDPSSLDTPDDKDIYLFGSVNGNNGTPVICKFDCSDTPIQKNKKYLCKTPTYIQKSVLEELNSLSLLIKDIESSNVNLREISEDEHDSITSLYASRQKTKQYDANIGEPDLVCKSSLDSQYTKVIPAIHLPSNNNPSTVFTRDIINRTECNYIQNISILDKADRKAPLKRGVLMSTSNDNTNCLNTKKLESLGFTLVNSGKNALLISGNYIDNISSSTVKKYRGIHVKAYTKKPSLISSGKFKELANYYDSFDASQTVQIYILIIDQNDDVYYRVY